MLWQFLWAAVDLKGFPLGKTHVWRAMQALGGAGMTLKYLES